MNGHMLLKYLIIDTYSPHSYGLQLIVTLITRFYYFQFSMKGLSGVWTVETWICSHLLYHLIYQPLTTKIKSLINMIHGKSKNKKHSANKNIEINLNLWLFGGLCTSLKQEKIWILFFPLFWIKMQKLFCILFKF